jgi:kynurenine formamidase
MATRHARRSPFGDQDQIGAMHYVKPEMLVTLFQQVKQGRIFDLSHEIQMGAPRIEPFMLPYTMTMWTSAERTRRLLRDQMQATNELGALLESVHMTMHTGTHIDALGHMTIADEMFNGFSAEESIGDWGLHRLGIEHCPPILTRGVVLDIARQKSRARLDAGTVITAQDLESTAKAQHIALREGDVVLVHTGWGQLFMVDNATYVAGEPGLGEEAAQWLTARHIAAIGADNMAVEVMPGESPQRVFPVHQHFLVEAGVYMIENLHLDEVCREGVYEFLFIALPVKYKGATASTLRPIGII